MRMLKEVNDAVEARSELTTRPPFGPGCSETDAAKVERLEVWGSGIKDPGEDFCEWRGFDAAGTKVFTRRVAGY